MRGVLAEKVERDFMITEVKSKHRINFFTVPLLILILLACKRDLVDDPIPFVPFSDIVINLTLPAYTSLTNPGGYVYVNNGGVRGIILYRKSASLFLAFERNCSFQPSDACATVDAYTLNMKDSCCGSMFNYDGNPVGGPAWRPLQQYRTSLSGNILTITDEIIN